jgi:hypothetical protein
MQEGMLTDRKMTREKKKNIYIYVKLAYKHDKVT